MNRRDEFDALWNSAQPSGRIFQPAILAGRPEAVRRYLTHAIAPGTPLASAVRLRMHGEIKLGGWASFAADEVICWNTGMLWRATVRVCGVPIRGSDSLLEGRGAMRWKLLGLIPVVNACGPDITRSAAGRVNAESLWLPSALCGDDVGWSSREPERIHASFTAHGENSRIDLKIDQNGVLKSTQMPRWGNFGGKEFREIDFGGFVEEEGQFGGYNVPVRLRIGWYPTGDGFEQGGEFFRVAIDSIEYR
jgi:hypothetical protein